MRLFARRDEQVERPAAVVEAPAEQPGAAASDAPTSHWAPKLEPLRPGGAVGEMLNAGENFEQLPLGGFSGEFQTPGPPPAPTPWEITELPDPEWKADPHFGLMAESPEQTTSGLDAAKIAEAEQSGEVYDPPPPKIFTEKPPPPPPEEAFVYERPDWRAEERQNAERDKRQAEVDELEAEEAALARALVRTSQESGQLKEEQS